MREAVCVEEVFIWETPPIAAGRALADGLFVPMAETPTDLQVASGKRAAYVAASIHPILSNVANRPVTARE